MQCLQFGARSEAEVLRQPSDEFAIRLACAGALAAVREPLHVCAQRGFVERVRVEQSRRQVDTLTGIDVGGEVVQGSAAPGNPQAIALEAQPARPRFALVVLETGEQLAAAQGQGIGNAVFAQRRLEIEHVGLGLEANGVALHLDPLAQGEDCRRNSVLRRFV